MVEHEIAIENIFQSQRIIGSGVVSGVPVLVTASQQSFHTCGRLKVEHTLEKVALPMTPPLKLFHGTKLFRRTHLAPVVR